MGRIRWNISPGAVLVFALWYFFDEDGLIAMLLPAVLVHEAGHALFLHLGGRRIRKISLGLFGLEIDHTGSLEGPLGFLAIAAGPLFGLAYGLLCQLPSAEFCTLSGGLSVLLSLFNLIPVLPLDGGRLLCMAVGERGVHISRVISLVLLVAAVALWVLKGWFSLFAMSAWLVWYDFRREAE